MPTAPAWGHRPSRWILRPSFISAWAPGSCFIPIKYFSASPVSTWNQPNLGFRGKSSLPLLLNLSAGYKYFAVKPGQGRANRELSYMPVVNYARQGGSQRLEAGLYVTATPVTLGAVYRNILLPSGVGTQQVVAIVAGIQTGGLRLGYSYDIALSQLNSELGGAHEVTIAVHAFDKLENAHRRLKRARLSAGSLSGVLIFRIIALKLP